MHKSKGLGDRNSRLMLTKYYNHFILLAPSMCQVENFLSHHRSTQLLQFGKELFFEIFNKPFVRKRIKCLNVILDYTHKLNRS